MTMRPSITDSTTISPNHRSFTVDVFGSPITTTVTSTPSVVRKWLHTTLHVYRYLRHRLIVGLGVQWYPIRHRGGDSQAATLQLCVGHRCLIFQLIHADTVPKILRRFLEFENNTFVGFWNHTDAEKLRNSDHELTMVNDPLDLRLHVKSKTTGESLVSASTETIISECLGYEGVRLERDISMSDWEAQYLDDDQVLQASVDARAAFLIGKSLRAWKIGR